MKGFVAGIGIGLVAGTLSTAAAGVTTFTILKRGDSASGNLGETICTALPHDGSRLGFVCSVGGDYRAKYGVIVNEREVAITQYSARSRYSVLVRKTQSPLP